MNFLESGMGIAIDEAQQSLREGNHGFGAVIMKDGEVLSQAHDEEETDDDPTSHAEINAIKLAAKKLGKDLSGCVIISTHEPCPMCSSAIVWSGIHELAYGYSIEKSIEQGRKRIALSCSEVFNRAGKEIIIHPDVLHEECAVLYHKDVRNEVKRLRDVTEESLSLLNEDSMRRRLTWFTENKSSFELLADDPVESAYRLLLHRFGIDEKEMPIVVRGSKKIVFHSKNFCPTLEACKILNLDTRFVCKRYNENSTDVLIKQIDPSLHFDRNYQRIRPYAEYCEEMIVMENGA